MPRIRFIWKTFKIASVILILYNEIFTYYLLPFYWSSGMLCASSSSCINILLVADPQILGTQDSSWIAKWDCDRYLSKSFYQAAYHTRPDLIIFLGDQMDEGHISNDQQFDVDFERFQDIFYVPDHFAYANVIYIPGDNDIGGEGDTITPHVARRFDRVFDQVIEPVVYEDVLEFYKVNKMTSMFQEPESVKPDSIRIALSHVPVLRKIHTLSKLVAASIKPHLIFSGHDHDSVHIEAPLSNVWKKAINEIGPNLKGWNRYLLSNDTVHEIVVPTSSYRMGTAQMGYGFVRIDSTSKTASYTVLWLPYRLTQLYIYLGFAAIWVIVLLCFAYSNINRRFKKLLILQYREIA